MLISGSLWLLTATDNMLELNHDTEPQVLRCFRTLNPPPYSSGTAIWKQYRDFEYTERSNQSLVRALHRMQEGLCVYCERRIFTIESERQNNERNRHIEHLRSRQNYPDLTLTYSNLALSCSTEQERVKSCGERKGNRELPILPTENHRHLFDIDFDDGSIIPALGISSADKKRVKDTCILLNINHGALCFERLQILNNLQKILQSPLLTAEEKEQRARQYCISKTVIGSPFAPTLRKAFTKFLQ